MQTVHARTSGSQMRVLDAVVRLSPVLYPRQQLGLENLLQVYQGRPRQIWLVWHHGQQRDIPAETKPRATSREGGGKDQKGRWRERAGVGYESVLLNKTSGGLCS